MKYFDRMNELLMKHKTVTKINKKVLDKLKKL